MLHAQTKAKKVGGTGSSRGWEKVSADRLSSKRTEVFITTTHKMAHQQIHDENTKQPQTVAITIFYSPGLFGFCKSAGFADVAGFSSSWSLALTKLTFPELLPLCCATDLQLSNCSLSLFSWLEQLTLLKAGPEG